MFSNLSLKTKIFSLVTAVVIASFLIVIWVVFSKTLQLAEKDAFDLAQETAEKYKNEIKAELQGSRVTAETLATVFETLKRHDLTDREVMNDILRSALAKKDYITAFCVAYDPDALDGRDADYAGQEPAYNATGRYSPYWNKLGGNIEVEPLYGIDIADWYIVPKETGEEYITDPYPYHVQGNEVMLASLVFPIVHEGGVIGIVASDMVLDKLQEMVSRVNPSGRGGRTQILSNSGMVVAHPDPRYLGRDMAEVVAYHSILADPGRTAGFVDSLRSRVAGLDGEAREAADRLIPNLTAYAADPGNTNADFSQFTPELAMLMLESNEERRQYVATLKDVVRGGKPHIARDANFYTVFVPIRFSEVTTPWSVAVSIPMSEVLANADRIRNYVTVVALIAIAAIALILYYITRGVTMPILRLAQVAKTIGEGDFTARIPEVGGGNEIGVLSGALRFMAEKNEELIGEMKGYAEQLEEKNEYLNRLDRLKDEFLANTSHELRTPIHGIIGIAESMVDGAAGSLTREQKYNLAIVANSGKRLANMINDILDFTKLKNKEIALQIKPVDLKTVVDAVLVLSKPLIKGKNLELVDEIPDGLTLVEADENRIQQILYNLIGNAVKFTEKGRVAVSVSVVDDMAAVSVSDSGIGIPEDKLDAIFESFEQVDGSIEREYGGTGLGLSITKKLVELHGGTLTVTSTPGEGSLFTFTIPASRTKRDESVAAAEPRTTIDMEDFVDGGEGGEPEPAVAEESVEYRILAVDDEPVNIQVLKNLLRIRNWSIVTAFSGIEALELLESGEPFDLVLLDVMMPKMSGYEVCRILRRRHSLFELPILMLTAKNQLQDIVLGFQSGANDYLSKPFDKAELLARVNTLLSLKQAVTSAIQNEKLFEDEKHKRVLEQTLLEVTNAITSTLDLKEVLAKVLEAMSHFIRFNRSVVLLRENDRFEVEVAGGGDETTPGEGTGIDVAADPFLAKIVAAGRPYVGNDLDSRFRPWCGTKDKLAGVPIFYRKNLLGIIVLNCQDAEVSRELLFTLAGQAGVAIQNARMFERINLMATMDGLTGLYNRRYFFELVEKEFAKYKRYGESPAVCMMDIDNFKKINDDYGHAVGDEVLRHLAAMLLELVREYDIVGRYGGEEFAIVFPATSLEVAAKVVERIRAAIESSAVTTNEFGDIRYTLSMGVSCFTKGVKTTAEVFDEADKALYEAKNEGRNRVVVKSCPEA